MHIFVKESLKATLFMTLKQIKIITFSLTNLCLLVLLATYFFQPDLTPLPAAIQADRIVIDKSKRVLTLYDGKKVIREYPVSFGRGGLAAKQREGDKLTPDGSYKITQHKKDSAYHRALRISYPDAAGQARAAAQGVSAGSDIMIHGLRNGFGWLGVLHRQIDWTLGCIAVTNQEVEEIWGLVQDGTEVQILPHVLQGEQEVKEKG